MPRFDVRPGNAPCIMQADDCCIFNKSSHVTNPFMAAHRNRSRARMWLWMWMWPRRKTHRGARCVERYDNWRHEASWRLSFVFFLGSVCIWPWFGFEFGFGISFAGMGHQAQQAAAAGQESICGTMVVDELGMLSCAIQ